MVHSSNPNIRILVNGTASFVMADALTIIVPNPDDDDAFRDTVQHSLTSYLSFWGTQEIEASLQSLGMAQANVTSISVDGIEIVVNDRDTWVHGMEALPNDDSEASSRRLDWDAWMWASSTGLAGMLLLC